MTESPLRLLQIDMRMAGAESQIESLTKKLAPEGDVVSEAGRRRTEEVFGEPLTPSQVVERICQTVQERGSAAVFEFTDKFDGERVTAGTFRVSAAELAEAHASASAEFLATVRRIRERIVDFQRSILHDDVRIETQGGGSLRQRYRPLSRIGICVPGGAAAYPSTVLMTAVPAQTAGVDEVVVVAPPTPYGSNNPDLLATCHELGIAEVYRVGGAQGVAALAYGVEGLPRVDKIVGPGNLFVALAKKYVFGDVGIESLAGPSEVIVIADDSSPPAYVAADMIAQAEHAPGSAILLTWSDRLLSAVPDELERQLADLERGELARQSLEAFGALIRVADPEQAAVVANRLATEHLHLACEDAETMLHQIDAAGAIFVGPLSPVALGDYVAGPSHVLPTGATARFASGLTANDFRRSSSVIQFERADFDSVADDVLVMAAKEGLSAHAASITVRRNGADART